MKLQEPITTDVPLCGLGDDYEPDVYFFPRWAASEAPEAIVKMVTTGVIMCFRASADCPGDPYITLALTIPEVRARAGFLDHAISLMDAELNVIRTWPV